MRRINALFSLLFVQDWPRILQFSPPRRPCALCRCAAAPVKSLCARRTPATVVAQAAQLLSAPSRLAGTQTGFPSTPRRPCARWDFAAPKAAPRALAARSACRPCSRFRAAGRGSLCPHAARLAGHAGGAAPRRSGHAHRCPQRAHPGRAPSWLSERGRAGLRVVRGHQLHTRAHLVDFLQHGGRALSPCALVGASRCQSRRRCLRISTRRLAPFPPRGLTASPLPPSRLAPPYADD